MAINTLIIFHQPQQMGVNVDFSSATKLLATADCM